MSLLPAIVAEHGSFEHSRIHLLYSLTISFDFLPLLAFFLSVMGIVGVVAASNLQVPDPSDHVVRVIQ